MSRFNMLDQLEIDKLADRINKGETPEVYFVANILETRQATSNHIYFKTDDKYKVIKVKIANIQNAYFEYFNYLKNPDQYHIETEEEYYSTFKCIINNYVVKNTEGMFHKDINSRIPPEVYGKTKNINNAIHKIPSFITEDYTNNLYFMDESTEYNDSVKWKYMELDEPILVDGISYKYVTSDWYLIDLVNFPMVHKPLINARELNPFFMELKDAIEYMKQLEA